MGAGVMPIGPWASRPRVAHRFVNAEGFPIVLTPPLDQLSSESHHIPSLSDLTHYPPFGAQLASLGDPDLPAGVLPFSKIDGLSDLQEEEEEGLFNANAVNEEDPERDRATPA